jgi:hypothetical protein
MLMFSQRTTTTFWPWRTALATTVESLPRRWLRASMTIGYKQEPTFKKEKNLSQKIIKKKKFDIYWNYYGHFKALGNAYVS